MDAPRQLPDLQRALGAVDRNRPLLARGVEFEYAQTAGRTLRGWCFRPPDWSPRDLRTVMAFFHGSFWDRGLVSQFAPQALYFAERGAVTLLFEYRLSGTDGTAAMDSQADVTAAHRWIGGHAGSLGIDPGKVVLAGASAGAWMAMVRALELNARKPEDRDQVPPAALVVWEPVVEVQSKDPWAPRFESVRAAQKMSPRKLLKKGAPPAIFLQGTADRYLDSAATARLAKAWKGARTKAEYVAYEGAGHGFHNFNVDARLYENSINAVDGFLVGLGLLAPGEAVVSL